MGLLKLVVYGGIGYLIYQAWFSDAPAKRESESGGGGNKAAGAAPQPRPTMNRAASGQFSGREARGMNVETHDGGGTSVRHKVGRGVVSR